MSMLIIYEYFQNWKYNTVSKKLISFLYFVLTVFLFKILL